MPNFPFESGGIWCALFVYLKPLGPNPFISVSVQEKTAQHNKDIMCIFVNQPIPIDIPDQVEPSVSDMMQEGKKN